jgi:acetyl esterase
MSPRDPLDPQIRHFVDTVSAAFARHPSFSTLSTAEARRIAEGVRAPWRAGGPKMLRTVERFVAATGGPVRVRIYDPAPAGVKAALVYLHGGGWAIFSLDTHDRVMREYAARAGVIVVGVDYPLSPEAKFPFALEQITDVVRWLSTHGAEIDVNPARLAIGGDSAGGNLALATCLKLRDAGAPSLLKGMLLNYGVFEAQSSEEADRQFGGPGFMLSADEMRGFWANYLRSPSEVANPLACPASARLEGLPAAFLTIPECDLLTEQSLKMSELLREAGVSVTANVYKGASHSFLEAVSVAAIAGRALDEGARWLRETLR